jgi:sRNA-binding carbon storage regulator CsrA
MGLLLLTRTPCERINIGKNITLTFTRIDRVVEGTRGEVKKLGF